MTGIKIVESGGLGDMIPSSKVNDLSYLGAFRPYSNLVIKDLPK